jgi:hypothetical protein
MAKKFDTAKNFEGEEDSPVIDSFDMCDSFDKCFNCGIKQEELPEKQSTWIFSKDDYSEIDEDSDDNLFLLCSNKCAKEWADKLKD